MAYQSFKRVLGETSLERKCRLLFGTCLLLLIAGAYVWVDYIAEDLVDTTRQQERENFRQRGRAFAEMKLLKLHFIAWANSSDKPGEEGDKPKLLVEDIIHGLENDSYKAEVLGFDGNSQLDIRTPTLPWEAEVMRELLREMQQRRIGLDESTSPTPQETQGTTAEGSLPADTSPVDDPPAKSSQPRDHALDPFALGDFRSSNGQAILFRERTVPDPATGEYQYHYFQPVIFKQGCMNCHPSLPSAGVVPASAEASRLDPHFERFRVVKIVLPYPQSNAAIHWIRAILSAAGIITFFVAMVALYVIVRYVIVSPLKHLRDVSDAISRGNLDLRAEIHTNDEFEELAASFNRMLRHLTESQANLQKVNQDLDAKVDELAQLNMRLYEMNRVKSEFLANMSHELRTPLNSIIGFSEILQGIDVLNDKQRRYAQNIQKSGRALLDMINDILDVAKIEAGKMDLRPSEFRIDSVVHTQCDLVRSLTEEKNIDLSVEVPSDLPPLFQDQGKVQQVLTNLLSNAIKFTPEGGRITVRARRLDDGQLELTVADTGVGIAEEDRDIIFEKFRQSRTVVGEDGLTREYSGTGLGLSIVRELCKLMRGDIDFESELGKGSTFRVVLPWTLDGLPSHFGMSSGEMSSRRAVGGAAL